MPGIVHLPGEGEAFFNGRIVLKSALPELTIIESWFPDPRPGADPHLHREHADAFYVLEGELAFLVDDREHVVGPGSSIFAPPGVVHGFRSLSPARFLNFHTPDGGFADNLRARERGEPGGFDSVDAEPGSGLPASQAILLHAGEGTALPVESVAATIKIGRDELSLLELDLEPGVEGSDPHHHHDDHTDAFYVLAGEVEFRLGDEVLVVGHGGFVTAPADVAYAFRGSGAGGRLLGIRAPGTGLDKRLLRGETSAAPQGFARTARW